MQNVDGAPFEPVADHQRHKGQGQDREQHEQAGRVHVLVQGADQEGLKHAEHQTHMADDEGAELQVHMIIIITMA